MEGNGYITLDLRSDNIATTKDVITFSFKTFQASGLLLHSSGSQGDYINIELVHGRIRWELNELGNLSFHGFEISYHLGHSLILSSARATKTKITETENRQFVKQEFTFTFSVSLLMTKHIVFYKALNLCIRADKVLIQCIFV